MAQSKKGGFAKQAPKIITYGLLLIVLLYVVFIWGNYEIKRLLPIKYEEQVTKYAQENGLDPFLVYAIINTESHFAPEAASDAGAVGLMQLLPSTAQWIAEKYDIAYSKEELTDPELNIQLGCRYFAYLLEHFGGDEKLAITAYNGGPANVDKWLEDSQYSADGKTLTAIPYKETANYVKKVTVSYEIYKKIYQE